MSQERSFDYLVVGGGTAGAVVAARLAEDRDFSVCLLEAGPSDEGVREILELKRWQDLLGSEYGYDFEIERQECGNSDVLHSRGIMLGGSSSHNSSIAFRPTAGDMARWEAAGAAGWGPADIHGYFDRVTGTVNLEPSESGNAAVESFLEAGEQAGFPRLSFAEDSVREGAGLFQLNKKGPIRQSSSVAYLHPTPALPDNLTVLTGTRSSRILFEDDRAVGVETSRGTFRAGREVVISCGAFDTPKLLMLSGVGPAEHLRGLGVPVVADVPGVGENLMDHPEGVVLWETSKPVPEETANYYEAGLFAAVESEPDDPDLMFHFGTQAFDLHTLPKGYPTAEQAFSMTPNVARAKSQGHVRLRSAEPGAPPAVDFRYFTDPEGYDERVMVEGVRLARELASTPALSEWVERELAPGPGAQGFEEISEYVRTTANTVYHPAGTCRMGSLDDPGVVVDPSLRARGVEGLRVADASVFPTMITVNPCITCMMIGERCADLVREQRVAAASGERAPGA